jgi:hypothetical protein
MEPEPIEEQPEEPEVERARRYSVARSAAGLHQPQLIARSDVVAVGVGERRVGGRNTGEPAVKVFVPQKIPLSDLSEDRVLPRQLQTSKGDLGVVDVEEMDPPATPPPPMAVAGLGQGARFVPELGTKIPILGASAGHIGHGIGSITARVRLQTATGPALPYLLSCNHVFANFNYSRAGDAILQPAALDGGWYPRDLVGNLVRYVPLAFGASSANVVDAALAEAVFPQGGSNFIDDVGPIQGLAPIESIQNGDSVRKVGRSTGLTLGTIEATHAAVKVNYWAVGSVGQGTICYDQIITTLMGLFGDSGSLLLDAQNRAVGMLFAGSATHTYYNYMNNVLDLLEVKM